MDERTACDARCSLVVCESGSVIVDASILGRGFHGWEKRAVEVARGRLVTRNETVSQAFQNLFEIDYAARHLCEDLNRMRPVTLDRFHFPLRYQIQ